MASTTFTTSASSSTSSTIYTTLSTAATVPMDLIDNRVRSLSLSSQPGSLPDGPSSPMVPAAPANTPKEASPLYASRAPGGPSTPPAPPNSPVDDEAKSSVDEAGTMESNVAEFLKAEFSQPRRPGTAAPPNSPETWFNTLNGVNIEENYMSSLDERFTALSLARPQIETITSAEVRILKEHTPKAPDNSHYEIRSVPGKGYGCFALAPIARGTRILADSPLLVVPIPDYLQKHVQAAFGKLSPDDQALYFTLHSAHGQDPNIWPKHIHESVTKDERCRISEQHAARIAKEPSLVSIFQTNCMEKDGGAAVFPHAARFNHSCNPNACFTWNSSIQKETIHAMRDIEKDEQITLAYCDTTHDKSTRRWELKHYGFECDCPACAGDETDENSFAAKSALRRFRLMDLDIAFKSLRGEHLETGVREKDFVPMLLEYCKLLREEGDNTIRLANAYLDIALASERNGDLGAASLCAKKALQVQIECQGEDFPDSKKYKGVVERVEKKLNK